MPPSSPPTRRPAPRASRTALVTAVVVGLALLAGCGHPSSSADGSSTDATGQADTAIATTVAPTTTVDPGTLPQTRDRPGTTDAAFSIGVAAMWQGIVDDNPDEAMAFFFPLTAYRQVKAVHDPDGDWTNRLVAAYSRDIHHLHAQLGQGASRATLVGLDVPEAKAEWINPGREYNKLGYWRVYGSQLRYQLDGTTHSMPIYSLISWRGEWYVVHVTHP